MIDDPNSLPPLDASDAPAPAADPAPPADEAQNDGPGVPPAVDQPTPPTTQPAQSIVVALAEDNSRVLLNIADPTGAINSLPLNFSTARRIALGLLNAAQSVEDAAVAAFVAQAQAAGTAAALAAAPPASDTPS